MEPAPDIPSEALACSCTDVPAAAGVPYIALASVAASVLLGVLAVLIGVKVGRLV